jgi:hypothetical protein
VAVLYICFGHAFIINYNYPRIHSLETSVVDQIRVQLDQEKDSVQRHFRHLASQEERQVSFRSHTLDRGFIVIHQRLNNSERNTTTTGYVEW